MSGSAAIAAIGIAGDWHGNTRWAVHALSEFHRAGVSEVRHLGDFGLWPSGDDYLDAVENACAQLGIKILVTPGNHEDYGQLCAEPGRMACVREHVTFLPRGHRLTVHGWHVLSFGGAPSIDFEHRVEGISWWPAELPTDDDVDAAIAGGPCDILLLHDSSDPPYATGAVSRILCSSSGWSNRALAYASVGRERITRLRAGVCPHIALHGHYHVADITKHNDGSWTVSMAADGTFGNIGVLYLPEKRIVNSERPQVRVPVPSFAFLAEADDDAYQVA